MGHSASYVHTAVNPVERRIQELAAPQRGQRKCYIQSVRQKVVVPNRRYSWHLFERLTDTVPVDTVVLDVNRDEACKIDRQVAQTVKGGWVISVSERRVPA